MMIGMNGFIRPAQENMNVELIVKEMPNIVTEEYDCSYRDYHPDQYVAYLNDGSNMSISKSLYEHYENTLGTSPVFVDMHRHFYTKDGQYALCSME